MNANWQEFLGTCGARIDQGTVADFGDSAAELVAARDATIVAPLVHLGLIGLAGDDARTFLHTQLTSDVKHLESNSAQHSAWCTPKGRMVASFLIYRERSDYRALLSADLLETIRKRLQIFVLRSKVIISDLSDTCQVLGLAGPQAEAVLHGAGLPAPGDALKTAAYPDGFVIRLDSKRYIIVVGNDAASVLWTKLAAHARPAGTPVWQWLDIQAGLPLISDATKEQFVPQMANFDAIGGVSFHKGCYPGQEIVARAQYLGKVKRHLYPIRTTGAMAAGTAILTPQDALHPCGMVVNAAPAPGGGFVGLAVIQENFIAAGNLELGAPGGQRVMLAAVVG